MARLETLIRHTDDLWEYLSVKCAMESGVDGAILIILITDLIKGCVPTKNVP